MINFTKLALDEFNRHLTSLIKSNYENDNLKSIISNMALMSFTQFSKSNSLYFSLGHTLSTSLIGLGILEAMKSQYGEVRQSEYINLMASVLFCNVGIIGGNLKDDKGNKLKISPSSYEDISNAHTSSSLWKYKGYRSREFVNDSPFLSSNVSMEIITRAIEFSDITKKIQAHAELGEIAKFVRAIQIISLMADENFSRRQVEFYHSAVEGKVIDTKIFSTLGEFKDKFAQYFWEMLYPDVGDVILLLRETIGGKNIVSKIYAHL
jgi:hypothetical protein